MVFKDSMIQENLSVTSSFQFPSSEFTLPGKLAKYWVWRAARCGNYTEKFEKLPLFPLTLPSYDTSDMPGRSHKQIKYNNLLGDILEDQEED